LSLWDDDRAANLDRTKRSDLNEKNIDIVLALCSIDLSYRRLPAWRQNISNQTTMAKEHPDLPKAHVQSKKKGFSVGPANLPDGTYRRKVTKIKKNLIHKAKVKKQYSKILSVTDPSADPNALRAKKLLEEAEKERLERSRKSAISSELDNASRSESEPPTIHPDRQKTPETTVLDRRKRRPKSSTYKKEESHAAKVKAGREEAAKKSEEMRKERDRKLKGRGSRKKAMSSRTRTGQIKLGKMSNVLLSKVAAAMGER
jgi:hypothetical protein